MAKEREFNKLTISARSNGFSRFFYSSKKRLKSLLQAVRVAYSLNNSRS